MVADGCGRGGHYRGLVLRRTRPGAQKSDHLSVMMVLELLRVWSSKVAVSLLVLHRKRAGASGRSHGSCDRKITLESKGRKRAAHLCGSGSMGVADDDNDKGGGDGTNGIIDGIAVMVTLMRGSSESIEEPGSYTK
ncbi:hypothetical protein BHM03_00055345 [Ensete ventricosum]|nr:hypothetical protein BHM03_00055345 [Ensete ventricosum]